MSKKKQKQFILPPSEIEQKIVMWACKCGRDIQRSWYGKPGEMGQVWEATYQFCGTKYKTHECKFSHLVNR